MKSATNADAGARSARPGSALDDPAAVDHGDLVREQRRLGEVVGDERSAPAPRASPPARATRWRPSAGRAPRGLVEEKDLRVSGQRPRQRDPLALAAGELARRRRRLASRRRSGARTSSARGVRSRRGSWSRPKATLRHALRCGKTRTPGTGNRSAAARARGRSRVRVEPGVAPSSMRPRSGQ